MNLITYIDVTYEATDDLATAKEWLEEIDKNYSIVGLDFEAAVKYSDEELSNAATKLETLEQNSNEAIELRRILESTALSHPSNSFPTHLSIGLSESTAKVIIIHTYEILYTVMNWLTTTEIKQVWHNASYDFKHIFYHTKKFPKNYEDTAQLAKSILNHVETQKAKVGLKELMGDDYGPWGISADSFTVAQMYEPYVLKYAATDGCATIRLWEKINNYLKDQSND